MEVVIGMIIGAVVSAIVVNVCNASQGRGSEDGNDNSDGSVSADDCEFRADFLCRYKMAN